ncbi:hypothetical protein DACRYDRAFT_16786 [Dacryopinax primogenitus]|uniref:Bromodomain associated domain-containing protein n=1 Tax=Dacryopinax primogenitus (strain DJM 731) TaxID=1858805 RepID=M5G8X7_DACPD|nr:uncharacterized protein DACRYDRAFT_16786 [Dacryopinax primogenitus]EJU00218.1 hypothetical protein DACRYDRAFT_16786 [Dacryopinax primogenitus]
MADVHHPHLHHAVLSTFAAEGFQKSSSNALEAATDILQRYMKLLARSCVQQAENAGRSGVSWFDVVGAVEEMGTELRELMEWAEVEGRVDRRVVNEEDLLQEWDGHVEHGLYHDPTDNIPFIYGIPLTPESAAPTPSSSVLSSPTPSPKPEHIPLSPVSLSPPSSPPPRRIKWEPPSYVPDFLPPLPGVVVQEPEPEVEINGTNAEADDFDDLFALPHELEEKKPSVAPPTAPTPQPIASFTIPTPFAASAYADLPRSLLPSSPRTTPPPEPQAMNPLFISAMQILRTDTHGAASLPVSPPAAHALSGLISGIASRRYDAPDTLFGGTDSPFARHAAPTPTHVVPHNPDSRLPLPPATTKSLCLTRAPATPEPPYLCPMFPTLTQAVLPLPIYTRLERVPPPPLLQNNDQFLYGPPRPALWNGHAHAPVGANGEKEPRVEEATLRATWEVNSRDYREIWVAKKGRMALTHHALKREWSGSGSPLVHMF